MVRVSDRFNSLPSELSPINLNISELVCNITLNDLINFNEYDSDVLFVSGNPWCVQLCKKSTNGQDWLGVYLHCGSLFRSRIEQLILATCEIQLIKPSLQKSIRSCPFSADNFSSGIENFILWDELINHCAHEDSCEFRIRVKATPLLIARQNKWLLFEEIAFGGYVNAPKKFRMTVTEIQNVVGVSSPNIVFNGSSWRIVLEHNEDVILVKLINTTKNTCRVSTDIKLMPFNQNVQPLTVGHSLEEFNEERYFRGWSIQINDLCDPERHLMLNYTTFKIEIELDDNNRAI